MYTISKSGVPDISIVIRNFELLSVVHCKNEYKCKLLLAINAT